jgi:hypothetical protein
MRVQICKPPSGATPGALIEEEPVYSSAMSSAYEYIEVPFTNVSNRTESGVCVVLGYASGSSTVANVEYENVLLGLGSILSGWQWSSSNGTTWSGSTGAKCLRMYIYGTAQ